MKLPYIVHIQFKKLRKIGRFYYNATLRTPKRDFNVFLVAQSSPQPKTSHYPILSWCQIK